MIKFQTGMTELVHTTQILRRGHWPAPNGSDGRIAPQPTQVAVKSRFRNGTRLQLCFSRCMGRGRAYSTASPGPGSV